MGMSSPMPLRFFRGLAVPSKQADAVEEHIKANGLGADRGWWRMIWDPPGDERVPGQEEPLAVCACGDFDSGAYYACQHNRSGARNTPILVEFEAAPVEVAVDGRDFLYPLFQLGSGARARDIAASAFGRRVLMYLDHAWRTTDQRRRRSLCREARHDPEVVREHHASRLVLGGRHGTRFRSAFLVKAPVKPTLVRVIHRPSVAWPMPAPNAHLAELLDRLRR